MIDIEAINARWRATMLDFGSWQFLDGNSWGGKSAVADGAGHPLAFTGEGDQAKADGVFMASAHEDVPALCKALKAAQIQLEGVLKLGLIARINPEVYGHECGSNGSADD